MRATRGLFLTTRLICCACLALLLPVSGNAGNGKIRIVDEDTGQGVNRTRGLVDLEVALNWDPTNPGGGEYSEDDLQRYFRTASVVLCDATEGRFRLGRVRFVYTASGNATADVYFDSNREGDSHAPPGRFGMVGETVIMALHPEDQPFVLSHELAHYLLNLKDQYSEDDEDDSCPYGEGYHDPSVRSEVHNTIMDGGLEHYERMGYCHIKMPNGDWLVGAVGYAPGINLDNHECLSTEDCEAYFNAGPNYNAIIGANPVWGQGPADNVVCLPLMFSELSTFADFDVENGLGPLFDRRTFSSTTGLAISGIWGDNYFSNENDYWADRVEDYIEEVLDPDDPNYCEGRTVSDSQGNTVCLDDCPAPRA